MGSFKLLIHFDIYSTENSRKRTYLMFNLNFIDFCEDMLESDASNKLGQGQEKLGKLWNALKIPVLNIPQVNRGSLVTGAQSFTSKDGIL